MKNDTYQTWKRKEELNIINKHNALELRTNFSTFSPVKSRNDYSQNFSSICEDSTEKNSYENKYSSVTPTPSSYNKMNKTCYSPIEEEEQEVKSSLKKHQNNTNSNMNNKWGKILLLKQDSLI